MRRKSSYHKEVMNLFDGFCARKRMEKKAAEVARGKNDEEEVQAPAEQEETDSEEVSASYWDKENCVAKNLLIEQQAKERRTGRPEDQLRPGLWDEEA